jgi:protein-tyrosine phosphatase
MIDTHSHVLWGVDDGAESIDDSLNMIQQAYQSGTTVIYASSHDIPNGKYQYPYDLIDLRIEELRAYLNKHKMKLEIYKASELFINGDAMSKILSKSYQTYQDSQYVLVEFNPKNIHNTYIQECLDELEVQSCKIIIAHPERYFNTVNEALSQTLEWIKKGYYIQINRTSILGLHGKLAKKIALKLLIKGYTHLVASDAHDSVERKAQLDDVYAYLNRSFGKRCSEQLLIENPSCIALDQPMDLINPLPWYKSLFVY